MDPTALPTRPGFWARFRQLIPEGHSLPAQDWETRHRAILWIIFGHALGLAIFGLARNWAPVLALGEPLLIAALGGVAAISRFGRRFRSATAALALVTSSAVFVQFWGGYIEGHFHFFVIAAIVVLYQDWVPFLLTVAYVALDHGVIGTLFPTWVYNHPEAQADPWRWAVYHAVLVLAECAALIYAWKMTERTRSQVDLVLNAAGEGILGLDINGRVAFANPAASAMTGRPMEQLLGQPTTAFLAQPSNGSGLRPAPLEVGDHYSSGSDRVVVRMDGSVVPVNWATSPIRESGHIKGHVVTLMDATAQQQMEEERRQRLEQLSEVERLKELNQFRTLFINTAAHELHTPLTPLRLNVFALKEGHKGELNPAQQEVVHVLERNVERLSQLVEDVLNAARLQANRMSVTKAPVDLAGILREVAKSFEANAQHTGVILSFDSPSQLDVLGDRQRLTQVMFNLVDNALKFTPRGGRVTVRALRDGTVEVSDTGVGLTQAQIAKLFQPFSQAHDHMQYTRSGSGLGLYISKGIMDLHGGRIWCRSDGPGKGTTFGFQVPLAEPKTARPQLATA